MRNGIKQVSLAYFSNCIHTTIALRTRLIHAKSASAFLDAIRNLALPSTNAKLDAVDLQLSTEGTNLPSPQRDYTVPGYSSQPCRRGNKHYNLCSIVLSVRTTYPSIQITSDADIRTNIAWVPGEHKM